MRVSDYNGTRGNGSNVNAQLRAQVVALESENEMLWRELGELRRRLRRLTAAMKTPHSAYSTVETRVS